MMRNLFQTRCLLTAIISVCTATLISGCNNQLSNDPAGYIMREPHRMELGKVLNEISGLSFNKDDTSLLAISDSKRTIFQISLKNYKLKDLVTKFWNQEDFEDVVKVGNTVYVLISNGTIVKVPLDGGDSTTEKFEPNLTGKNDIETLYYDSTINSLVMICKSCDADKNTGYKSAYRFDLQSNQFDSSVFYKLSNDKVKQILKRDDADFKPSAAAIHPIDKRLYILASAGNLLVISDTKGNVLEAYNLNIDYHPQAEGIAFSPNGTMLISNEAKNGIPTLQIFPYNIKLANAKKTKR